MGQVIDLKEIKTKIEIVEENQEQIQKLTEEYNEQLESIINQFLKTGKQISNESQGQGYLQSINNLILVPWKTLKNEPVSNINYLRSNPDRRFFVSSKSITEVYFEDSLAFEEVYELIANEEKSFTVELTFNSARQRNREKFVFANKYRFVWSWFKNEMSIRKLEE